MTRPRNTKPLAHIGPYDLTEKVGSGGMGAVYRARDTRDGSTVALKLMHEHVAGDPSYAERFRREAAMAALIDSPNVVRVLEFASDGGRPYIVTEFVDGLSVEALLKNGPLPADQAIAIAAGVANALGEANRRSIVHRDIKPANVLLGAGGVPKVTDFGIATLSHASSLTVPGMFIGTAAYAAPEQHRGEADVRSDLYSLGVVIFEMLTGSLPFAAETATGMMRQHEEARVPLERLAGQPPALVGVVGRCLEKSPGARFQDPGELAAALATGGLAFDGPPNATVVAAASPAGPLAVASWDSGAPETRIDAALFETGEHPIPAVPLAALRARFSDIPLLRKALLAGAAVACLTVLATFSLRGSSAGEAPMGGSGGGNTGPVIDFATTTPVPSVTATPVPSVTTTPVPSFTVQPGPKGPPPIAPVTVTVTPTATRTSTPPPPAPKTVTPAPAKPVAPITVVGWVFCQQAGCPAGQEELYSGAPIGVGFALSSPTSLPVSVEVWFDGVYYYTSNFTPSANGMYFDLLPFTYHGGDLALDIYVGGEYLDTIWAEVYQADRVLT